MGAYLDLRGWVDLGLPSGKLWCIDNEEGYFLFDEAVEKFQDQLPTIEDWQELMDNTTQRFDKRRKGLVLKAPNGKKLFLPAMGFYYDSRVHDVGSDGYYWSATPFYSDDAMYLGFDSANVLTGYGWGRYGLSIRLIKAK